MRISNQIFAVFVVLLLVKSNFICPKWVDVRKETYGIYLIHPFTLIVVQSLFPKLHLLLFGKALAGDATVWSNPMTAFSYWTIAFVATYASALLITKMLIYYRLGVLVGTPYRRAQVTEMPRDFVDAKPVAA